MQHKSGNYNVPYKAGKQHSRMTNKHEFIFRHAKCGYCKLKAVARLIFNP